MRLLFVFALVVAVVAGDKMMMEMKMWAKMKAMESCLGEDVMRSWMVKMKRAASKCSGIDAPELDLPIFKAPYKLISTLTAGSAAGNGGGNFERLMEKYLQMQMLKQFSDPDVSPRRFRRESDDDDDDEVESVFDLGERLNAKLMMKKDKMEAKVGNMTCVLQELGYMNSEKEFDLTKLKKEMDKIKLDPWLDEKLTDGCEMCEKMANSLPKEMTEKCIYGPELAKVHCFKKCMKMMKFKTCMNFDIKKKLEKNFGSVNELVSQTGLEEEVLFEVVKQMLKGPEEMMMGM